MRGMKSVFFASTIAVLCACGGGGGGDNPAPGNASATGIWQGTMTIAGSGDFEIFGLVYGAEMRFVSVDANAVYEGVISIDGSGFTANTSNFDFDDGLFSTSSIQGTVRTKESIIGTFTSTNDQSGTLNLSYDPITDRGSSLATIAGTWSVTNGTDTLTLTVSNGAVTGADTDGCVYSGSVDILDASVNIYSLDIDVSNCGADNAEYAGFAVLTDGVGENDVMGISISNPTEVVVGFLNRT